MMIVNDDSRVINKLEASLTDDARVFIYDCHMFIVQAIDDVIIQAKYFWLEFQVPHLLKA
jgi:hypothetical protein